MTNSMAVANISGEYGIVDLPGTSTVSYQGRDISPQLLAVYHPSRRHPEPALSEESQPLRISSRALCDVVALFGLLHDFRYYPHGQRRAAERSLD